MPKRDGAPRLRGRRRECEALDELVACARPGDSRVLVLQGRLGGGVFGDLAPELPASQLAILPGTTHVGMLERPDWNSGMVTTFFAT